MKILVIGDSIGLPHFHRTRDEVEIAYECVYPEQLRRLLQKRFPDEDILLLNQCRHANTSHALVSGAANELLFVEPDVLVLQLGMADLWPSEGRTVPAPVPEMEGRDPWIPAEAFRQNLSRFLAFCDRFDALTVQLVNIPKVSDEQYSRHPAALERTKDYNLILQELACRPNTSLVDAFGLFETLGSAAYCSDGIHPTRRASQLLAEVILEQIAEVDHGVLQSNLISKRGSL
jgi:lysophospholipase L1-like esterase